ncbi:MAG TPA: hypothetical protein VEJ63_24290 [Planctomycetota bacterium]|nr:hypothetical protein [Planctomycetota bacterium]
MNASMRLMLPALVLSLICAASTQAADDGKAKTESVTLNISGMT